MHGPGDKTIAARLLYPEEGVPAQQVVADEVLHGVEDCLMPHEIVDPLLLPLPFHLDHLLFLPIQHANADGELAPLEGDDHWHALRPLIEPTVGGSGKLSVLCLHLDLLRGNHDVLEEIGLNKRAPLVVQQEGEATAPGQMGNPHSEADLIIINQLKIGQRRAGQEADQGCLALGMASKQVLAEGSTLHITDVAEHPTTTTALGGKPFIKLARAGVDQGKAALVDLHGNTEESNAIEVGIEVN